MNRVFSSQRTHPGQKRKNNEDYVTSFEPDDIKEQQESGSLYIVADGVGGAAKGEKASKYAGEKMLFGYYQQTTLTPRERLRTLIPEIGHEIYDFSQTSEQGSPIATTMVVAVLRSGVLTVANVGDSRAYLIRNNNAKQITRDHSMVGELIHSGELSEEEALASRIKNKLTRSIGGEPDVHVELYPEIVLKPGDKILLCTDGLSRYTLKEDVEFLTREGTTDEIADRLIEYANRAGGADNVSVIVIAFEPDSSELPTIKIKRPPQPAALADSVLPHEDIHKKRNSKLWLIIVAAILIGLVILALCIYAIIRLFQPESANQVVLTPVAQETVVRPPACVIKVETKAQARQLINDHQLVQPYEICRVFADGICVLDRVNSPRQIDQQWLVLSDLDETRCGIIGGSYNPTIN